MEEQFDDIWDELERKMGPDEHREKRIYRRLDLENESGVRVSIVSPGNRELLIQIDDKDNFSFFPPKWIGMKFGVIVLDTPHPNTKHISLSLENTEYSRIFTTVCSDIADSLSLLKVPSKRTRELQRILNQWSNFFKSYGPKGLSPESQRGLYGELTWLEILLENKLDTSESVESWKGFNRSDYDFELNGQAVEVKTTTTKEPRKVRINNERQLDEQGLLSLFLYVLSLQKLESGGEKLPSLVGKLRNLIESDAEASNTFEKSLKRAGYFDHDKEYYDLGYVRKKQEIFEISEGFPRLISLPDGVGDISYSVTLSACSGFLRNTEYVVKILEGCDK